jgi:hypothetical protein
VGGVEQRIADRLEAFERARDTLALSAAVSLLEADLATAATDPGQRKFVVEQWLRVLAALDRHLDPSWNPQDVPQVSLTPPPAGGVTFPSGVDPAAIPDPAARREYEQALQEARNKADAYRFQLELRRADERAMAGLARFLADSYRDAETSRDELGPILAGASPGTPRHARLEAAMERADRLRGETS